MTSIKTGSSSVNLNYNVHGVGPVVGRIISNVSSEHGAQTLIRDIETQEFDVSNVSINEQTPTKLTREELNANIDSIDQMIDVLQQEADKISQNSQYTYEELANVDNVEKREEANAKRAEIESYITQLEYLKKEYEKSLSTIQYDEKAATDEYNNFISNYDKNYQDIDFELFTKCDYDTEKYLMQKYGQDYQNHEVDLLAIAENYVDMNKDNANFDLDKYVKQFVGVDIDTGNERINAFDFYMYSTQEQKDMYHYIFANEGSEKANEYLNLIMDDINRNKGFAMASDYTNTLMLDDSEGLEKAGKSLVNLLSVNARGLEDGVSTFFNGIDQVFKNDGTLSAEDYEKMFVLQYLQENTNMLDESYTFFSAAGNMVPSMLASAAISVAATPAAGSVAASALMGMSAGGNAKHDALINGADPLSANIYAIANGSSEALLGYFLGNMPWVSKESEFGIKALLKEGKEEFIQEWVDAGLRAAILGEDIDLTQVSEDSAKSFLMGIAMAGLFSGGQQVVNMAINGETIKIDTNKLLDFIQKNPDASVDEILSYLSPRAIENYQYSNDYVRDAETEKIMNNTKLSLDKLINEDHLPIDQVIYGILNETYSHSGSTIKEQRYTARAIVEYLIDNGYTPYAAANIVTQVYQNVFDDIGYSTYYDESSNTSMNFLNSYDLASNTIASEVIDAFNKMPPELQNSVNNINFYDTFNPADFYWEMEYDMDNFNSAATGGQGVINIWNSINNVDHTVSHEAGHSYDTAYAEAWGLKKGEKISESKIWLDAMKADEALNNLNGVSDYARRSNSSVEDFADAIAMYVNDPSSLDQFPNRKALLEQHLSKVQNTNVNMDFDLVDVSKKLVYQGYTSQQLAEILRTKTPAELIQLTKNVDSNNKDYQGWLYDHHRDDITKMLIDLGYSESDVNQLYNNMNKEEIINIIQEGISANQVNYTTNSNQNTNSIFTSNKRYNSTADLKKSIQNSDPINNYAILDRLTRSLTYLEGINQLNNNTVYSTIVRWNSNSNYKIPTQQTIDNYWNKIMDSNNIVQYQTGFKNITSVEQFNQLNKDNNFVHVKSKDFSNPESRLYLNIDLESAYKILPQFMDKCKEQGIPYYFKTAGYSGGKIYNESNFTRDETVVIYSSEENAYKYVNILKDIMENDPSITVDQKPILTSNIDGVIGYSEEPLLYKSKTSEKTENYSYNSLRAEVITDAYQNLIKKYGVEKVKKMTNSGGSEYNNFLKEFYNEIHKVGEKKGVDSTNIALNDSSNISSEYEYLLKNKNSQKNQIKSVNLNNNDYNQMNQQFSNAYNMTQKKYGKDIALQRMQKYIETGNINYITSEGRQGMTYSVDQYREYVKKITNGSLNVYNMFR